MCIGYICGCIYAQRLFLGGRTQLGTVGETTYLDANTLPLNSIGNCSPLNSSATNYPPGVARGEIETIAMALNGGTRMQKFWERGGDTNRQYVALYVRSYIGENWYAWRKTTFDTYTV